MFVLFDFVGTLAIMLALKQSAQGEKGSQTIAVSVVTESFGIRI